MGQGPKRGGNGCHMERPCEITRRILKLPNRAKEGAELLIPAALLREPTHLSRVIEYKSLTPPLLTQNSQKKSRFLH